MAVSPVPVTLFAYARPDHLRRTLQGLRDDRVPLLHVFCDGPRSPDVEPRVAEVRRVVRGIDWCEVVVHERESNLGLGRSILDGVGQVLSKHESIIVFEDDLTCVPGTYRYLTAALEAYRDDPRVMSVTGWTHPDVVPPGVGDQPYFDGRTESWSWGTWASVWRGMDESALELMGRCTAQGIDIYGYGADLPAMAADEEARNLWAVRFAYLHILRGGLCLRPPWSMVDHFGFDEGATNAAGGYRWANPPLQSAPPLPQTWPSASEDPNCPILWRRACGATPAQGGSRRAWPFELLRRILRRVRS